MLIKCNILLLQNSPDSSGGRQKSQTITIMRLPAACVMDANSRPPPNCHCHSSPSILCIFSHAMNRQTGCKTMESVSVCCYSFLTSVSISKQLLDENSLIFTVLQGSNPSDTGNRWGSSPPPWQGVNDCLIKTKSKINLKCIQGKCAEIPSCCHLVQPLCPIPQKTPENLKWDQMRAPESRARFVCERACLGVVGKWV